MAVSISLKPGSQMQIQMQKKTMFTGQTKTQGRQDTQPQSRTVKLFPRWQVRVKLWLQ